MGSSPQERCPLSLCSAMAQLSHVGAMLVLPADPAWEHWMGNSVRPPLVGVCWALPVLITSESCWSSPAAVLVGWQGWVYGNGDEDEDIDGEEDGDGEEVSQRALSSHWDNQCSQLRGDCLTPETSQPGWTWGSSPAL